MARPAAGSAPPNLCCFSRRPILNPSEENKSFAAAVLRRLGRWVGLFRLVEEAAAFERGEGIVLEQGLRDGIAAAFGDLVIGGAELQRAALQVVGVARDEMNASGVEPLLGAILRGRSESPQNREGSDLCVAALVQPAVHPFGLCAQQRVALRMGDD